MHQLTSLFLISCAILFHSSPGQESASEHVKKGKQAIERGEFDQALEHLESAIRLDPKNAEAYSLRAKIRELGSEYDQAISDLTEVIRLNSRFPKAYSERAFMFIMKRDWDKAERDYTEAIRVDTSDAPSLWARAMIYYDK